MRARCASDGGSVFSRSLGAGYQKECYDADDGFAMFGANSQSPLKAQAMADDKRKPLVSRTRWVVGLLLMIAIPIFIGLAQRVVPVAANG